MILTREQVRRVDQLAVERFGISGLVLMENAGRNAADLIRDGYPDARTAVICCGTGNNGGDGCVIARHLSNAGWKVRLLMTGDKTRMTPDTLANYEIVERMGLELHVADEGSQLSFFDSIQPGDVIVDALLGTGFTGQVREPTAGLIHRINESKPRAVVAIDVPSGLDCDTGEPSDATIRADLTVTFVARKVGFENPGACDYVGRIEVADIGVPVALIREVARESG